MPEVLFVAGAVLALALGFVVGRWSKAETRVIERRPPTNAEVYMAKAADAEGWAMELIRCGRFAASTAASEKAERYRRIADRYVEAERDDARERKFLETAGATSGARDE